MRAGDVITAIEVGTTKICTIVEKKVNGRLPEVVDHSVVPCAGLKKGNVEDINLTSEAIRESLKRVREKTDVPVTNAYVGITGSHVGFDNKTDSFDSVGGMGVITSEEVDRIPDLVSVGSAAVGREVLHALPKTYRVDGHNGITDPTGMHASGIEVTSHVVTVGSSFVRDLETAVISAGPVSYTPLTLTTKASG